MRTLSCEVGTEISGNVLRSLLHNIQTSDIEDYVEKYNLTNVQEGDWYPLQSYLALLNELATNVNQMANFVAIGIASAQMAIMPSELGNLSFEGILIHWDDHYQSSHRNGDVGYKTAEKIGHNCYQLTNHHGVYPDDLEYGMLYGLARQFLPMNVGFTVSYAENVQHMDQGGEATVFIVEWD